MNRRPVRFRTLLINLAVGVLTIAGHQIAQAKDTWISVHSQNFTLIGNASEKDIRQVAPRPRGIGNLVFVLEARWTAGPSNVPLGFPLITTNN